MLFFVIGNNFWTYDSGDELRDNGDFNARYTQELCRWCEVGASNMIVPKLLMTMLGVAMAYVARS